LIAGGGAVDPFGRKKKRGMIRFVKRGEPSFSEKEFNKGGGGQKMKEDHAAGGRWFALGGERSGSSRNKERKEDVLSLVRSPEWGTIKERALTRTKGGKIPV